MRIGIVTLPLHRNYGGILQNWALQQVLKKLGHTPFTIDAYVAYPYSHYLVRICGYLLLRLFGRKSSRPRKPYRGRVTGPMMGDFIVNNITLTNPVNKYKSSIIKQYGLDAIIVGSDQIWRPKYNERIETVFLDFIPKDRIKKIAFSVSLGSDTWEFSKQETENCKKLISEFSGVSVREITGIKLLCEHLDCKPELTLDPTLLLHADNYYDLCADIPCSQEPYMAVYCLDPAPSFLDACNRIAKELNMSIRLFGADENCSMSVKQWIATFRDARRVVTDSYHGAIFSILFDKPVLIYVNQDRGASRIDSLFSILAYKSDQHGFRVILDRDSRIKDLREKSILFLTRMIDA